MPIVVAGAVIERGALLIAQRAKPAELAGKWELPGGKVIAGESEPEALRRELFEELGIEVRVGHRLGEDVVTGGLTLRAYLAELRSGTPRSHEHLGLRWVGSGDLAGVDWVDADRAWVGALGNALVVARPV